MSEMRGNGVPASGESVGPAIDLRWVWSEVSKRVFIKIAFSLLVADAMEAAVPIALDGDTFVVGLSHRDYPMANQLTSEVVRNTIEGILRTAAGRNIRLEVIEGTTNEDWEEVRERRRRAQDAVIAMAQKKQGGQHTEDLVNQIISELRARVSASRDRTLPQVRAGLLLDIAPQIADAEEMLFPDLESHESRRSVARLIDRVAAFLEVPPLTFAIEVERHRRAVKEAAAQRTSAAPTSATMSEPTKGVPGPEETAALLSGKASDSELAEALSNPSPPNA